MNTEAVDWRAEIDAQRSNLHSMVEDVSWGTLQYKIEWEVTLRVYRAHNCRVTPLPESLGNIWVRMYWNWTLYSGYKGAYTAFLNT